MPDFFIDGSNLNLENVYKIAKRDPSIGSIKLSPRAAKKVLKANQYLQKIASSDVASYGINTGFGLLSDVKIPKNKLEQLQINLLRSHACGVGQPLSEAEVRGALLLRANTLAQGASGVSLELIEAILNLLNKNIIPWVPEQGSVGACGDLAPLAHLALVLIGEGKAYWQGKLMSGEAALKAAKVTPYKLKPKEGLSLINGTQIMTAIGALVLKESLQLAKQADLASAMSLEACRGTTRAFDLRIHKLRPHKTQLEVAKNMNALLAKSEIADSHKDCGKVQDPYSFRCIPQVHGASREFLNHAIHIVEIEMNSVTDNPLVFPPESSKDDGEVISGGNFHGEYVAQAMDGVAIALAEIANISDLRMQKLINPNLSGLPAFLTKDPGLNSGMMIVQVSAASLVSENKVLSHPASVDSIPTSADKEDHVSMGVTAARKARQILINARRVLAMEFLCASQGLEFLQPLKAGQGVQLAYKKIRKHVLPIEEDRAFHNDIEAIETLLLDDSLLQSVEAKVKLI